MVENTADSFDRPFDITDWQIDPSLGRISRGETIIKLEPKVMQVLVCLARDADQVISREQLEASVWAGQVVGYDSLASTIIKLRKAFGDDSKNPQFIETVPKRGYRLIADVTARGPMQDSDPGLLLPEQGESPAFQTVENDNSSRRDQDEAPGAGQGKRARMESRRRLLARVVRGRQTGPEYLRSRRRPRRPCRCSWR